MASCIFCMDSSAPRRVSEADWMDSVSSSPLRVRMISSLFTLPPSRTLMAVTVPEASAVRVRSA